MKINNNKIGPGNKCYIIAEMSGNHRGDIQNAKDIIYCAKEVGADAIKLQTYKPETITLDSYKNDFLLPSDNPWAKNKNLFELYKKAFTPWEWHEELFQFARQIGIDIFSSPFDSTAVDLLEQLNTPAYKIASPEITDIPLLKYVAKTKKPVIISTGVALQEDIELAVKTLRENGANEIAILKCTSSYPTPPESVNLLTMPDFKNKFDCLYGLSDHTLGIAVPVASVALGASIIEKHFIIEKDDSSVDSFFSLDKAEFAQMINAVRFAEKSLGKVTYNLDEESSKNLWGRRSLYICKDINAGEVLTKEHVKSVRPAYGLHPKHYDEIIGKTVTKNLQYGDRVSWDVISK